MDFIWMSYWSPNLSLCLQVFIKRLYLGSLSQVPFSIHDFSSYPFCNYYFSSLDLNLIKWSRKVYNLTLICFHVFRWKYKVIKNVCSLEFINNFKKLIDIVKVCYYLYHFILMSMWSYAYSAFFLTCHNGRINFYKMFRTIDSHLHFPPFVPGAHAEF